MPWVLVATLLLASCDTASDLDEVCHSFTELAAEPSLAQLAPNQRLGLVNERISAKLSRFSQVRPLWQHVPNYESEARYRMFKRTAEELLGRPWDCPDMQRLAPTLSVPVPQ